MIGKVENYLTGNVELVGTAQEVYEQVVSKYPKITDEQIRQLKDTDVYYCFKIFTPGKAFSVAKCTTKFNHS